jgi:hypothetical protein
MNKKKTAVDLALLKAKWLAYPYWVLENAGGFDDYRAELRQFRLDTHAMQEREKKERLIRFVNSYYAEKPGLPESPPNRIRSKSGSK